MPVEKDTGYLTRQRVFVDDDGKASVGVGIIDGDGEITGTALHPLSVGIPVLERIAAVLERIEQQLSFVTELQIKD